MTKSANSLTGTFIRVTLNAVKIHESLTRKSKGLTLIENLRKFVIEQYLKYQVP